MTRIAARELAVHFIFSYDFGADIDEMLVERLDPSYYQALSEEDDLFEGAPEGEEDYIRTVVTGVCAHLAELDGYIEAYAKGWKFGRMPRVAISVMRVCMYELLYMPEIPNRAAINAAIDICKKYEEQSVAAFINGILGSFVKTEIEKALD